MPWSCPPLWEGATAFIVAGGTSVGLEDLSTLRGRRVIAVNSSVFAVPFADVLVWNDVRWWLHHAARLAAFRGLIVTTHDRVPAGCTGMRKVRGEVGIATDRRELAMARTTTQAAINLAVHLGVRRIALLGVDLCEVDGRRHHHDEHPWPPAADAFEAQRANLKATVAPLARLGLEVINCSAISAVDFWPKRSLGEVLACS